MTIKQYVSFCVIALAALSSCKKNGSPKPGNAKGTLDAGVYVSGAILAKNFHTIAVYWKNGVLNKLSDSLSSSNTVGIAATGNHLYIGGIVSASGSSISIPVYWDNGVMTKLTDGLNNASINAIAVSGNDVYVAGFAGTHYNQAAYWKNGVLTLLSDVASFATGIFVSGTDVYVCGSLINTSGATLVYWKNGALAHIYQTTPQYAIADGIAVTGNNVYVAYHIFDPLTGEPVAYMSINGVSTLLNNNVSFSNSKAITVNGGDVYAAGFTTTAGTNSVATYWKNNVEQFLTPNTGFSSASAIDISGTDVYVAGYNLNGQQVYWKNGAEVSLPNPNSSATGIAVVGN